MLAMKPSSTKPRPRRSRGLFHYVAHGLIGRFIGSIRTPPLMQQRSGKRCGKKRRTIIVAGLGLAVAARIDGIATRPAAEIIDPLSDAITAYRQGVAAFENISETNWASHGGEDAVVDKTYRAPLEVIQHWDKPAITMGGATDAVRFAHEENLSRLRDPVIAAMLAAALAYLDA